MVAEATEAAEMASRTWAGETAEISDETLQRWRDDMELAVTKEAEAQAGGGGGGGYAYARAVPFRFGGAASAAKRAFAPPPKRRRRCAFASRWRRRRSGLAAEAKALSAKKSAAESAARLKESEQKLQEIKKQKTAEPPAWLSIDAVSAPVKSSASKTVVPPPDAALSTGAPPLPNQAGFVPPQTVAPGVPVPATPSEWRRFLPTLRRRETWATACRPPPATAASF
jgi:hypothetical protein